MPKLRKDPIMGRWVIIADERAQRPHDFHTTVHKPERAHDCPFCEGNEHNTPPEVDALRDPNTQPNEPGWRVRVVRNKFPALMAEGSVDRQGNALYETMAAVGAHEVIIDSPRHVASLSELPAEAVRDVFQVYRDRLRIHKQDRRFVHGIVFKNVGAGAGASLEHTHSQLMVTPIVPINIWQEITGSLRHYNDRGRCVFCEILDEELKDSSRVVMVTEHFVAFCPYAGRFPFEIWVVPRRHDSHYENIAPLALEDLGALMKLLLHNLEEKLERPPYNYIIHSSPFDHPGLLHYHWHIEIIPRLTQVAGFEWGTGFYINPVPPEQAAEQLRAELPSSAPSS